jgi:ATP-binding cassette subfamily C (CFTR/MRP) protein 1
VLPFFHEGYSNVLQIHDIPEVDEDLQGKNAGDRLQLSWDLRTSSRRLLGVTLQAYRWSYISGVIPRLALSAFTFCQPFLITATVDYIGSPTTATSKNYGQALVGAYVLVYLGIAVGAKQRSLRET